MLGSELRIAMIPELYYPYVMGGVERRYWEVSRRLARKHEVHVFTMQPPGTQKDEEIQGVHVHRTYRFKTLYNKAGKRKITPAVRFAWALRRRLNQVKEKFDIVDCSEFPFIPCYPAKKFAEKNDAPFIVTVHEVWGDYWNKYLENPIAASIGRFLERRVVRWADRVIAISKLTADSLQMEFNLNPDNIHLVPNGIDLKLFTHPSVNKEPFKVLYVGRLVQHKHVDWLIEAMRYVVSEVQEASLHIVGDGPLRSELEVLAHVRGLDRAVRFYGAMQNYADVASQMKTASVFVSPSTVEGFGMVVLESMAASTPAIIVNSKQNAALEFVTNRESGLVAEPEDPISIAEAIIELFKDTALYEKIVHRGRELASMHSWDSVSRKLEEVYNLAVT